MSLFPVSHEDPGPHAEGDGAAPAPVQGGFSSFDAASFLQQQQKPSSVAQQGLSGKHRRIDRLQIIWSCMAHLHATHLTSMAGSMLPVAALQRKNSTEPSITTCHPAARTTTTMQMRPPSQL